jgi:NAD(P)H dehydrogenase (quinone)
VSTSSLLCTSCGAVWLSESDQKLTKQSQGCLRCGGKLLALDEAAAPAISGKPLFAVTQAACALGRRVAARLAHLGVAQRLLASSDDTGDMHRAMAGVQTLFLASAEGSPNSLQHDVAAVDAAVDAGVERIVYVSVLSAAANATFKRARDDFQTEEHARATGVPCTFLRPSLYFDLLPTLCSAAGVIENPAGDGRVACVSRDDVADVAVVALTKDHHDGRTYDVTGPVAQTMTEIADELALAAGRPISYRAQALQQEATERAVSRFAAIAAGEMDVVADTVAKLSGHEPQTFSEYLREHPESYEHILSAQ